MKWLPFFFIILFTQSALASEPKQPPTCQIKKLRSIQNQRVGDWEVSIEKENNRKKPGDAFLGINKHAGKFCEIELESWGSGLFVAQGKKLSLIIEQGDTNYSTLTWIDPEDCKAMKTLREFGTVKIQDRMISFSGGSDGPEKIPAKKVKINSDCLPSQ